MALRKEITLPSGVTADYWRVSHLQFKRATMVVDLVLDLYKDDTVGLAPLGKSFNFSFTVTQLELAGNIVSLAYTKIKAMIEAELPPINGSGPDASRYPELVGAEDA